MALSKFGAAFAAARKAGKKEFSFGGKRFHTRTKEEEDARKKKAKKKPSVSKGTVKSRNRAGTANKNAVAKKVSEKNRANATPSKKSSPRPKAKKPVDSEGINKRNSAKSKAISEKRNVKVRARTAATNKRNRERAARNRSR